VFDSYRTREVGCVAQECEEHQGYHISADTMYVETIPIERKKSVEKEFPSYEKILITDLTNYSAPIVRYEIGDVGNLSERRCPCGRGLPLLENIGGRISDLLYTPEGKKVSPVTVIPNLFHLIGIMNQFQIIQDKYDQLIIKLVKPEPEKFLIDRQKENIKKIFGSKMKVRYQIVDSIDPLKSGKYSFVISKIKN
jgi:phenylacetate-CoA ligase